MTATHFGDRLEGCVLGIAHVTHRPLMLGRSSRLGLRHDLALRMLRIAASLFQQLTNFVGCISEPLLVVHQQLRRLLVLGLGRRNLIGDALLAMLQCLDDRTPSKFGQNQK